ncbi:hypothetical protein APE_0743 [Aeropyrum pernix K1]|uniref:Uncharacterized protein n=1 Tax=Aeropyrum pernix (strain ATCC 700893 / DSM 11879 / JCM 9820 / NBRC 100138 / K1) TaxID=272557 RepID=Q9YE27_AERPE|nr:hypothetical protein [Aeropyrum pernix]BAA79720.1 hypothetical protein APE_0743 [Aeropyrum pernix K1]
MSEQIITVIRVRLVGRRWRLSFLKALAEKLMEVLGGDTEVRINSFIAQPSRLPITDVDIFSGSVEKLTDVRRAVEDVLQENNYPLGRLLTVKHVQVSMAAGEG